MFVSKQDVIVTTIADGSATAFSTNITGRILNILYTKNATNYTDGVDFTITNETTGQTIWTQLDVNATVEVAPRQPTHSNAGVAALYASAGQAVNDYIYMANERVKIVIASGGDTKIGTFTIIYG